MTTLVGTRRSPCTATVQQQWVGASSVQGPPGVVLGRMAEEVEEKKFRLKKLPTTAAVRFGSDDGVHILLSIITMNRFGLHDGQPRVVAKSAGQQLSRRKTREKDWPRKRCDDKIPNSNNNNMI